jgi:ribosomal protein S18 acetylase RimI-like enzyme
MTKLPEGYRLYSGSEKDRVLLLKYLSLSYQDSFLPQQDFSHLAQTVEQYLTSDTPLWWVEYCQDTSPIACLWLGNAIDQVTGDRYSHIFLLYVLPEHRRRGIGRGLMEQAQEWAKARGDRQIGLQVFPQNQKAINLYLGLGYQIHSLSLLKQL